MPKIVFNENFGVDEITIVLERRDFSKYGKLKDVTDIEYKDTMNAPELSFNVYKTDDPIWNKINNYNLVYIPEYKEHFSISVNTTEENTTQKSVTCTYLPVSELQNVKLRNIQINTEDDIARDDYDADYPTIFYRDLSAYSEGSTMYKKLYNASLLHRILDKASNYKIGHVDTSLKDLKSWFQYSISDSNIYDELTGEISDDYQCLFKFNSNTRTVNVYDLCNTCHDCGYRGDFHDKCPECGSTNYNGAYGEDTSIYVSKENLSTSASIESSEDSLKNCFYITGGDDLMTSAVAIANPSGTNYIVEISDEMYENMPEDLVTKIKTYNSNYQDCMSKRKFTLSANLVEGYNTIVKYVNVHYPKFDDNGNNTDTINNLLALKEFQPIVNKFETGNWIHVCVDEKIYYLRLLSYKIFYSDISKIEVEFSTVERTWSGSSDVKSVIESAQAIASSFSYTTQKVKNNTGASKYVQDWVQKGMNATVTKIVNNADNQNVVYDSSGILCRAYDDLTETYDLCQSRWINSGLYVTDDGWKSVKAAVGKYIYIDPETGNEVTTMGVIGDTIVGKLIVGKNLGIYNINNSMTFDMNGLKITNGINTFTVNPNNISKLLKISKSDTDIFYVDDNGNLNLTGNVNGCSFDGGKINIGDGNFVVNSDGSVISKASLSFGDGALTYDPTNGMSVNGDITSKGFKAKNNGNVYMASPYISSAIYMKGLGWSEQTSDYTEIIGSNLIHGTFYPKMIGTWYSEKNYGRGFYCDGGDAYISSLTQSGLIINPMNGSLKKTIINGDGISTKGNIACSGTIQGNSSTATKLKTARTIKIGDASKTFDGSANVTWSLSAIGAASTSEFASAVSHINSLSERVSDLETKVNNLTK